jgi:hypothetical protein
MDILDNSLTEEEQVEVVTVAFEEVRERAKVLYFRYRRGRGNAADAFNKGFEAALEFAASDDLDQIIDAAETAVLSKRGRGLPN